MFISVYQIRLRNEYCSYKRKPVFAVTLTCILYLFRYIFNISYENMNFKKLRCSRVNKFYLKEKKRRIICSATTYCASLTLHSHASAGEYKYLHTFEALRTCKSPASGLSLKPDV